jgi:hypothetical protein
VGRRDEAPRVKFNRELIENRQPFNCLSAVDVKWQVISIVITQIGYDLRAAAWEIIAIVSCGPDCVPSAICPLNVVMSREIGWFIVKKIYEAALILPLKQNALIDNTKFPIECAKVVHMKPIHRLWSVDGVKTAVVQRSQRLLWISL